MLSTRKTLMIVSIRILHTDLDIYKENKLLWDIQNNTKNGLTLM